MSLFPVPTTAAIKPKHSSAGMDQTQVLLEEVERTLESLLPAGARFQISVRNHAGRTFAVSSRVRAEIRPTMPGTEFSVSRAIRSGTAVLGHLYVEFRAVSSEGAGLLAAIEGLSAQLASCAGQTDLPATPAQTAA